MPDSGSPDCFQVKTCHDLRVPKMLGFHSEPAQNGSAPAPDVKTGANGS
jgi:hypothetical protein